MLAEIAGLNTFVFVLVMVGIVCGIVWFLKNVR